MTPAEVLLHQPIHWASLDPTRRSALTPNAAFATFQSRSSHCLCAGGPAGRASELPVLAPFQRQPSLHLCRYQILNVRVPLDTCARLPRVPEPRKNRARSGAQSTPSSLPRLACFPLLPSASHPAQIRPLTIHQVHVYERLPALARAKSELVASLCRQPTKEEVAARLGSSVNDVEMLERTFAREESLDVAQQARVRPRSNNRTSRRPPGALCDSTLKVSPTPCTAVASPDIARVQERLTQDDAGGRPRGPGQLARRGGGH